MQDRDIRPADAAPPAPPSGARSQPPKTYQSTETGQPRAKSVGVRLNGQPWRLAAGASIAALLDELGVATSQAAVEINLELVPRSLHATRLLVDGDQIEIVTLVGGG